MSIASTVLERFPQANGSVQIVERHTDHLGGKYMQSWTAPVGMTQAQIDAKVAEHVASLLISLADGEFEKVIA